jgi:hypothetical protein
MSDAGQNQVSHESAGGEGAAGGEDARLAAEALQKCGGCGEVLGRQNGLASDGGGQQGGLVLKGMASDPRLRFRGDDDRRRHGPQ